MNEYHKIKTLWKRQSEKPCNMLLGEFAKPEFELLKDLEWVATEKGGTIHLGASTELEQQEDKLFNIK